MPNSPMSKVIEHLRRAVRDGGGLSDGQLLQRFIEDRDEAAFEALVRRHGPMVLGVCRRILGHAHDAEDAFQATFLVLVRKAAAVVPREAVGNWLYGVSYHTALKAKAASAKRGAKERQVKVMPEPEAVRQDIWQELQPLLDQELSRLPDKYRLPIVLCDLQGRTRKEVARQLRIPEGTLSSRLTTARRMLAQRLARRGVALSGGALAVLLSENAASACVPTSLVVSTAKAATLVAAGQAVAAGVISAKVAALTEGVLKTMLLTKIKIATAVALMVVAVLVGGSGLTFQTQAGGRADAPQKDQNRQTVPPKQDQPKAQHPEDGPTLVNRLGDLPAKLLKAKKTDAEIVDALFLATLGRLPTEPGRATATKRLQGAKDRSVACRDVLWALLNSKEFLQRHKLESDPAGTLQLLNNLAARWEKKGTPKPAAQEADKPQVAVTWKEGATMPYEGAFFVFSVALSPDGKTLATGINHFDVGKYGEVVLWDTVTGKVQRVLEGHAELVYSLAFSPDGKSLATASHDKTAKLWDIAAGKELRSFEVTDAQVSLVTFSPDGKTLAVGWAKGPGREGVKLLDVASREQTASFRGFRAAFSPDGKTLATGTLDGVLKLWDVATGKEQTSVEAHGAGVSSLAFSPDGKTLATVSSGEDTVKLWDVATAKERALLKQATHSVYTLAFSPDGKSLAVPSCKRDGEKVTGMVILWDVATGQKQVTLPVDNGPVTAVAFASKNGTLAAASFSTFQERNFSDFVKGRTKVVLKVWELK